MKKPKLTLTLLSLLALCGAGAVRADDNGDKRDRDENVPLRGANGAPLNFRLIPVSAFNPSITVSNAGIDQLAPNTNNHLAVLNDRTVQIEFHPVVVQPPASLTYNVWFCRFGALLGPDAVGCVALLDPGSTTTPKGPLTLTVDASGAAKGTAVFPALATNAPAGSDVWSGSFVITRQLSVPTAEFVSAFEFPSAPEQQPPPGQAVTGAEVELKGEISGLDTAGNSFQLVGVAAFKVVANESTRFIGRYKSLEDLNDGMEVEVHGTFETESGTDTLVVLADRIKASRED